MTNRRLVSYRDLSTYYPTVATGNPGSAGWFRQAAHNLSSMMNVTKIDGASLAVGLVEFAPSWSGVTLADTDTYVPTFGGYVRVGTICYLAAGCDITAIGTEGLSLDSLPVPPADSVIPMHAGYGQVWDGVTSYLPIAAEISGGGLTFYYVWNVTDGRVIDGDSLTVTGTGSIQIYAAYRCAAAPDGYLSDATYLIESQEPV